MNGWFERLMNSRVSSRPVAVARLAVAAAAMLEATHSATTLFRLDDPGILHAPYVTWTPRVTDPLAAALIGLWLVSALSLLIGYRTRVSAAVLTGTIGAALVLDQQVYSNHLYLIVLGSGLMAICDSGAALSLDARRNHERLQIAGLPARLIQVQVSLVYGFAALSKLNPDFLSGSVVASYLRRIGPLAVPEAWRVAEPMLILSVLAICTEAFLAIALWSSRWRPAALVLALALHVGITAWLEPTYQLFVFSVVMLPLLIVFLSPARASRVVVWDDGCGFCAVWVRWFRRLDWLDALRFVPRSQLANSGVNVSEQSAARALQLVDGSGTYGGFAAVGRVLEILPIAFLWAPLLRLPPLAAVGERVYRRVAQRRRCELWLSPQAIPSADRTGRIS